MVYFYIDTIISFFHEMNLRNFIVNLEIILQIIQQKLSFITTKISLLNNVYFMESDEKLSVRQSNIIVTQTLTENLSNNLGTFSNTDTDSDISSEDTSDDFSDDSSDNSSDDNSKSSSWFEIYIKNPIKKILCKIGVLSEKVDLCSNDNLISENDYYTKPQEKKKSWVEYLFISPFEYIVEKLGFNVKNSTDINNNRSEDFLDRHSHIIDRYSGSNLNLNRSSNIDSDITDILNRSSTSALDLINRYSGPYIIDNTSSDIINDINSDIMNDINSDIMNDIMNDTMNNDTSSAIINDTSSDIINHTISDIIINDIMNDFVIMGDNVIMTDSGSADFTNTYQELISIDIGEENPMPRVNSESFVSSDLPFLSIANGHCVVKEITKLKQLVCDINTKGMLRHLQLDVLSYSLAFYDSYGTNVSFDDISEAKANVATEMKLLDTLVLSSVTKIMEICSEFNDENMYKTPGLVQQLEILNDLVRKIVHYDDTFALRFENLVRCFDKINNPVGGNLN